jgi:hypothetical protein
MSAAVRASPARPPFADSTVEVIILLTSWECLAASSWGVSWFWGVALRDVPRGERFSMAIDFAAILSSKDTTMPHCAGRNNAC